MFCRLITLLPLFLGAGLLHAQTAQNAAEAIPLDQLGGDADSQQKAHRPPPLVWETQTEATLRALYQNLKGRVDAYNFIAAANAAGVLVLNFN